MSDDCVRAQLFFPQFPDCDVTSNETEWLRGHLESCPACRAVRAAFIGLDRELIAWGEQIGQQSPPAPRAREQLIARLAARPAVTHRGLPRTAAVLAIAAIIVLAIILPHRVPPVGDRAEPKFIAIPYTAPLDPRENATIVRMDIRVANLLAAGYRIAADPDAIVSADVLVGEDGRAHAVQVLSDIAMYGKGE